MDKLAKKNVSRVVDLLDSRAKKEFKKRLHEEEKHLLFVRKTLLELTRKELSSPQVPAPAE